MGTNKVGPVSKIFCAIVFVNLVFIALFGSASAQTGGAALVIGNKGRGVLSNPSAHLNARTIENKLKFLNFDVTKATDLKHRKMRRTIEGFLRSTQYWNEVVIYFSGRYVKLDGQGYLLPHDFKPGRNIKRSLRRRAYPLSQLLKQLAKIDRQTILFIDGCYELKLRRTPLEECGDQLKSHEHVLVSFNSRRPAPLANSDARRAFADALSSRLMMPDVEIRSVLRSVHSDVMERTGGRVQPWMLSGLSGPFYFRLTRRGSEQLRRMARRHATREYRIRRKRRTGYMRDPRTRTYRFRRSVNRIKNLMSRLPAIYRRRSPHGGMISYGACRGASENGSLCANLRTQHGLSQFKLKVSSAELRGLASVARHVMSAAADGHGTTSGLKSYLKGFVPVQLSLAERSAKAAQLQAKLNCDVSSLKCLGKALMPDELQRAITPLRHVSFLPIESLAAYPLAMLPHGDGWLIDKVSMTVLPNVESGVLWTGRRWTERRGEALVIADPDLTGRPHNIPTRMSDALEEGRYAAATLGGKLLAGKSATLAAVRRELNQPDREHSVIYFSTHGVANAVDPMDKSLLLLSGGDLTGQIIKSFKLKGRPLVVMSACQTGLGKTFRSGVFGLAEAWFAAGAGSVLISLWDVEETATMHLMKRFIGHYKDGLSAEVALARATRELKSETSFRHPRQWASFLLYGSPTRMPVQRSNPTAVRRPTRETPRQ